MIGNIGQGIGSLGSLATNAMGNANTVAGLRNVGLVS